jgi:hypothetical protein
VVSILVWISPWAAIMLVDYFVIWRGALNVDSLCGTDHGRSNAAGLISLGPESLPVKPGSTDWFQPCRVPSPSHSARPTSLGCPAVSSPARLYLVLSRRMRA